MPPRPAARRALPLLEILVVAAILFILLAVVVAAVVNSDLRGRSATVTAGRARATLAVLRSAMSDFLRHNPEPTAANWQTALQADPNAAKALAGLPKSAGKIIDGYGTPIDFIPPNTPPINSPSAFFRSAGPDRTPNTPDDIYSDAVTPSAP
jgi:type II secretory pathway pseudopilin PulG